MVFNASQIWFSSPCSIISNFSHLVAHARFPNETFVVVKITLKKWRDQLRRKILQTSRYDRQVFWNNLIDKGLVQVKKQTLLFLWGSIWHSIKFKLGAVEMEGNLKIQVKCQDVIGKIRRDGKNWHLIFSEMWRHGENLFQFWLSNIVSQSGFIVHC